MQFHLRNQTNFLVIFIIIETICVIVCEKMCVSARTCVHACACVRACVSMGMHFFFLLYAIHVVLYSDLTSFKYIMALLYLNYVLRTKQNTRELIVVVNLNYFLENSLCITIIL